MYVPGFGVIQKEKSVAARLFFYCSAAVRKRTFFLLPQIKKSILSDGLFILSG